MQSYTKGNIEITYRYDSDGLRTKKVVNGVTYEYYYVDGQLVYEKKGDEYELFYRYDADGRIAMVFKNRLSDNYKSYCYVVTNTRGDVLELHNGPGDLIAKYTYDSWVKLISVTNANGSALAKTNLAYQISVRYRSYVYDEETGLYYLQSRYYDPETGRFINADDVEYIGYDETVLSYNAFAYCGNEPIGNADPSGFAKVNSTRNITHHVYVYKYSGGLGHVDIAVPNDGVNDNNLTTYSYGTNGANFVSKVIHKAKGYLCISKTNTWTSYMCPSKHKKFERTKVGLTNVEFMALAGYLTSAAIIWTNRVNVSKKAGIKGYYVTSGEYMYYSYTKANCSTFVMDALIFAIPYLSKKYTKKYLDGLYLPKSVYNFAKLI